MTAAMRILRNGLLIVCLAPLGWAVPAAAGNVACPDEDAGYNFGTRQCETFDDVGTVCERSIRYNDGDHEWNGFFHLDELNAADVGDFDTLQFNYVSDTDSMVVHCNYRNGKISTIVGNADNCSLDCGSDENCRQVDCN